MLLPNESPRKQAFKESERKTRRPEGRTRLRQIKTQKRDTINPRLTEPFFVTRLTKGGLLQPPP